MSVDVVAPKAGPARGLSVFEQGELAKQAKQEEAKRLAQEKREKEKRAAALVCNHNTFHADTGIVFISNLYADAAQAPC